jgi:MinD superfamily P-loop ATPase
MSKCPFDAISEGTPYYINPSLCDECGVCVENCPVNAIDLPTGL